MLLLMCLRLLLLLLTALSKQHQAYGSDYNGPLHVAPTMPAVPQQVFIHTVIRTHALCY
jgi:hypothetical protein